MRSGLAWLAVAFCLGSAVATAQAAAGSAVELPANVPRVPVWQELRIVTAADRSLTPDQAAEQAAGSAAVAIDSPNRILGRAMQPYWARVSLHNPEDSEQSRLLEVETTTQFDIRLFERDHQGVWQTIASVADTANGRLGGGTTHPVWMLRFAPRQSADLLLRIEGPAIVRFPVFATDPTAFAEKERRTHVLMGIALGVCLFVSIYIGSMRRHLGDASVPLFLCMVAADLVGGLWLSGFLDELFPALGETTISQIGFAAYAMLYGSGSLHARIYLGTSDWAPRTDRLLHSQGWLWLALAPWFSLAFPVAARILLVWGGPLIALVLVVVSILATRRRIPFSGFIVSAWLAYLLVGSSFLIARVVNNPELWSSNIMVLAQAPLIAILFGLAMGQRLMRQRDALIAEHRDAVMQGEKAAELMRERSLLFAATNHDLRQPLLGVSLFADLLKSATTQEEREEHARKLSQVLAEVDGLLVGIQQLAAVNDASNRPVFETVRLDDLLGPVVEEYRGRSAYKHITLRYVPSRVVISTHVPYFQRIVRNVLSNAIRYTDRGDRILVGCRHGGGLRLVILDTGHGMTAEQTRRAFDAFQRFDSEMSIPDGFGLGLFSTKSLANALGLEVSLHSREGRGTEFRLLIPRFEE